MGLLRGSDRFYVRTSQMDVLLTAVCCCLVPTPVNSHVRAHNLLQVHSAFTNLFSSPICSPLRHLQVGHDPVGRSKGDDILAEQSYHTSSQVSHPCLWDLGGRSSSADHLGKEIFPPLRATRDTEWNFFNIFLRLPTFVRSFLQTLSGGKA